MRDYWVFAWMKKVSGIGLCGLHRNFHTNASSLPNAQFGVIRSDAAARGRLLGWTATLFGIGLMGAGAALMLTAGL